ncbi:LamG-like jellyroll fold domain-containing protein [Stratiformator vulcanicus]|nr:LamG-like jellyroll fold domain-containing protein [Stratiformator vulcanicus]
MRLIRLTEAQHVPDEVVRDLYELLETDPEARRDYAEYMQMVWSLEWDGVPHGSADEAPPSRAIRTIGPIRRYQTRRRIEITAAISAGLLASIALVVLVVISLPATPEARLAAQFGGAKLLPVFEGAAVQPISPEGPVATGGYRLDQGMVCLEFSSGSTVVVEGPASFIIADNSHFSVDQGLYSIVGRPGFTVATRGGTIIDLGTEFTVEAATDHVTTQVVSGAVKVGEMETNGDADFQRLQAGDAATATSGTAWTETDFDVSDFLPPAAVVAMAEGDDRPYYRWLAQSRRIRRDSDVLLYMTFGDVRFGDDWVSDQSTNNAPPAKIFGARPVTGRFAETTGLSFRGVDHADVVLFDEEFSKALTLEEPRTLAVWFRTSDRQEVHGSLIATNRIANVHERPEGEDRELPLSAKASWAFRISGHHGHSTQRESGLISFAQAQNEWNHHPHWQTGSMSGAAIGSWMHAVAVVEPFPDNPKLGTTKLYINGRLEAERSGALSIPGNNALKLGGMVDDEGQPVSSRESFEGTIDEFLVYGRALEAAEIEELYDNSRPAF